MVDGDLQIVALAVLRVRDRLVMLCMLVGRDGGVGGGW
jgi:hypothetical protein